MRQGNVFRQSLYTAYDNKELIVSVPLELEHDLRNFDYVDWTDNRDGTYTLKFGEYGGN